MLPPIPPCQTDTFPPQHLNKGNHLTNRRPTRRHPNRQTPTPWEPRLRHVCIRDEIATLAQADGESRQQHPAVAPRFEHAVTAGEHEGDEPCGGQEAAHSIDGEVQARVQEPAPEEGEEEGEEGRERADQAEF
jgi:hypothetical protein